MLDIINSRRSVRKFSNKIVTEKDIKEIVEAGMNAPSAGNEQAWQMIVLTDKEVKEKYASFNQNAAYVKNAPCAILICGDKSVQKYDGFYVHDCCAATENILLAIHAKGLGGVWCNVFPNAIDGIKKLLNIPEHIVPFSIVPFGYYEKMTKYESRFDETKLHYNQW
jgi:nitroreductase